MEDYLSNLAKRARDRVNIVEPQKFIKPAPIVSMTDLIFQRLRAGVPEWGSKPLIVDVNADTIVLFKSLEQQSLQVASSLARRGFRRGDVLYHVTHELAQSFVVMLAAWRLGGSIRGAKQDLEPVEYVRQIRETGSLMVLVDAETAPKIRAATVILGWPIHMFSVGNIEVSGATSFSDLLKDAAFTKIIDVNPDEDVVLISNTTGITGVPVTISHTHTVAMEFLYMTKGVLPQSTIVHSMAMDGIATFAYCIYAACSGITILHVSKSKPMVPPIYTIQHQQFREILQHLFYKRSIEMSKLDDEF